MRFLASEVPLYSIRTRARVVSANMFPDRVKVLVFELRIEELLKHKIGLRIEGSYRHKTSTQLNGKLNLKLSGNEVYCTNASLLLTKILLCSKLHLQKVSRLKLFPHTIGIRDSGVVEGFMVSVSGVGV